MSPWLFNVYFGCEEVWMYVMQEVNDRMSKNLGWNCSGTI